MGKTIVSVLVAIIASLLGACGPRVEVLSSPPLRVDMIYLHCGTVRSACCRAPDAVQNLAAFGPLVSCQEGLGCDIGTNICVTPCGGTGQACCDGPETRAPKWTADGKVYSPNSWTFREMCDAGACDRQTHTCFSCGTEDGGRCCPPDAAQATARCVGEFLECQWDDPGFFTSGTCRACGRRGKPPCRRGCEGDLGIRNGLCDVCGGENQPPCDTGCQRGLEVAQGLCRKCGGLQQIPCDRGCNAGLGRMGGLCAVCGGQGQAPCDTGCKPGTRLIDGRCVLCGYSGQPPCLNGCVYPLKVAGGVCRQCGANGQTPCDVGCDSGLILSGGKCVAPQQPPPTQPCASAGQSCVADWLAGTHCCQTGGPLLCVWNTCKPCIPHGAVCPNKQELCCNAKDGDICRLDVETEKLTCGLPG